MRSLGWQRLVVCMLLLPARSDAAAPSRIAVQGVLRDSSGKLQSMMVSITVKVYDAQTMGTLLGTPAIRCR